MHFRELIKEDFADHAEQVYSKIGALAASAHGKFKAAKSDAESKIKDNMLDLHRHNEKQKKLAAKATKAANATTPESAASTVAKIVISRNPQSEADLGELQSLDADQFNQVVNAVDAAQARVSRLPEALRKALKSANVLKANDNNDADISERLGGQPASVISAAMGMIDKDKYGEHAAWTKALSSDPALGAKSLLWLLATVNKGHEQENQSQTATNGNQNQKKVHMAEGSALVNMLAAQCQGFAERLTSLKGLVSTMARKPIVPEHDDEEDDDVNESIRVLARRAGARIRV